MWLRLSDDVLDDPKVQKLPAPLFKIWVNLLCLANKGEQRGLLPDIESIAFRLRISDEEAEKAIATLTERGLLDTSEEGVSPHNWNSWQSTPAYPSWSPENSRVRMQKSRENKKSGQHQKDVASVTSVTSDVTSVTSVDIDKIRGDIDKSRGEVVATCAGVHENSAEPVDPPATPPLLESDWATPSIQRQAERPPIPSPMDTPPYWKELEKEGYSPEEIVAGLAKMRNERNKDPDTMTSPAILGYLRRLMPDIRGQTQTANAMPKPKTPEELAKERKERQKEEERQAREREIAYIAPFAKEKGMTHDEYIRWVENENAERAAAYMETVSRSRREGREGRQPVARGS